MCRQSTSLPEQPKIPHSPDFKRTAMDSAGGKRMTMQIELVENAGEQERLAILEPLMAYNDAQVGEMSLEKFALLVRDESGARILGGLYGKIACSWLFIELLSVPEQARGQGTGSRLLRMAEELARKKACVGIWLDTFSFQAPIFYEKNGFTEIGQITDYPPGYSRHFFQKRLNQDS
jgi:GNAT superfamily N-acetyltransferase